MTLKEAEAEFNRAEEEVWRSHRRGEIGLEHYQSHSTKLYCAYKIIENFLLSSPTQQLCHIAKEINKETPDDNQ